MCPKEANLIKSLRQDELKLITTRRVKRQRLDRFWPEGIIPYEFDDDISQQQKATILSAIAQFHKYTCVLFVPRNREKGFIKFYPQAYGCDSIVGHTGGAQAIKLEPRCFVVHIIVHELMHALGFWHEHRRSDRDKYIKVIEENIRSELLADFKPLPPQEFTFLTHPYDYDSLLHYAETDGSINSSNRKIKTIISRDPQYQKRMGLATTFSRVDLDKIRRVYSCNPSHEAYPPLPAKSFQVFPPFLGAARGSNSWALSAANSLGLVRGAPVAVSVTSGVGVMPVGPASPLCVDQQVNCGEFKQFCRLSLIRIQCLRTCGSC